MSESHLPRVSFVMPCYNEELVVQQTVHRFIGAFRAKGISLELVTVDNGSSDRTGELLARLAETYSEVRPYRVEVNRGYGFGILSGIRQCTSPWIGVVPADGQVDAEDTVRLFEDAVASGVPVIAKARRRFRMDGPTRKLVSIAYNGVFKVLYPGIESLDINGLPKVMPRSVIDRLELTSERWFLDPEIMIKSRVLRIPIFEYNVFARMRGNGLSHVRATTCWEFLTALLRYRFSPEFREWSNRVRDLPPVALTSLETPEIARQ